MLDCFGIVHSVADDVVYVYISVGIRMAVIVSSGNDGSVSLLCYSLNHFDDHILHHRGVSRRRRDVPRARTCVHYQSELKKRNAMPKEETSYEVLLFQATTVATVITIFVCFVLKFSAMTTCAILCTFYFFNLSYDVCVIKHRIMEQRKEEKQKERNW